MFEVNRIEVGSQSIIVAAERRYRAAGRFQANPFQGDAFACELIGNRVANFDHAVDGKIDTLALMKMFAQFDKRMRK